MAAPCSVGTVAVAVALMHFSLFSYLVRFELRLSGQMLTMLTTLPPPIASLRIFIYYNSQALVATAVVISYISSHSVRSNGSFVHWREKLIVEQNEFAPTMIWDKKLKFYVL